MSEVEWSTVFPYLIFSALLEAGSTVFLQLPKKILSQPETELMDDRQNWTPQGPFCFFFGSFSVYFLCPPKVAQHIPRRYHSHAKFRPSQIFQHLTRLDACCETRVVSHWGPSDGKAIIEAPRFTRTSKLLRIRHALGVFQHAPRGFGLNAWKHVVELPPLLTDKKMF